MKLILLFATLLATGCFITPAARPATTKTDRMAATADPFPIPKSGMTLAPGDGKTLTLDEVLNDFQRATGVHVVATPDLAAQLSKTPSGLSQSLEIPASQVYSSVETLLAQNGFVLVLLQAEPPVMVGVESALSNQAPKHPWIVQAADVDVLANHPAWLVSTMVSLKNVDVRTLANSMRQMMQNPNVQQLVPMGDANSILVCGRAKEVAALVRLLQTLDEEEGRARAERAETERAKRERNPVKKEEPQPK